MCNLKCCSRLQLRLDSFIKLKQSSSKLQHFPAKLDSIIILMHQSEISLRLVNKSLQSQLIKTVIENKENLIDADNRV